MRLRRVGGVCRGSTAAGAVSITCASAASAAVTAAAGITAGQTTHRLRDRGARGALDHLDDGAIGEQHARRH